MTKATSILAAWILFFAVAAPGAARADDRVITHQEIVESAPVDGSETAVIEKHTTIEKHEGDDVDLDVGGGGVVSSTVDLTGEVLALPFKLVAGVLDLVF